jgi:hypothetical protein
MRGSRRETARRQLSTLQLSAREGNVPPELTRSFPLRLDLVLDAKEGWFTVLKDTELDLTRLAQKG